MPFRLNTMNSRKLTAILKAPQTHGLNDLNLRKDLLARIKAMLEMLERRLREAITAIIEFSRSVFKEISLLLSRI